MSTFEHVEEDCPCPDRTSNACTCGTSSHFHADDCPAIRAR